MALVVAFVSGAVIGFILLVGLRPVFEHPMLARTNLHGRPVSTAGGLVIVLSVLVAMAVVRLDLMLETDVLPDDGALSWTPMLTAVLGFGLLGFVDDLLGDASSRGFRGHLSSMSKGRLTTGGLKLVGGGVVALVAVLQSQLYWGRLGWLVVDVALVALAANLANLFDRAPGRVTKIAVPLGVLLAVFAPSAGGWSHTVALAGPIHMPPLSTVFVLGAAVGLLLPELRERMMLGDTGANAIGAALGLGAVLSLGDGARVAILAVLFALNLASERVSFSRVIASTPGLRQLDQLGRARE